MLLRVVGFNKFTRLPISPVIVERTEEISAQAAISIRLASSTSVGVGVANTRVGRRSPEEERRNA